MTDDRFETNCFVLYSQATCDIWQASEDVELNDEQRVGAIRTILLDLQRDHTILIDLHQENTNG